MTTLRYSIEMMAIACMLSACADATTPPPSSEVDHDTSSAHDDEATTPAQPGADDDLRVKPMYALSPHVAHSPGAVTPVVSWCAFVTAGHGLIIGKLKDAPTVTLDPKSCYTDLPSFLPYMNLEVDVLQRAGATRAQVGQTHRVFHLIHAADVYIHGRAGERVAFVTREVDGRDVVAQVIKLPASGVAPRTPLKHLPVIYTGFPATPAALISDAQAIWGDATRCTTDKKLRLNDATFARRKTSPKPPCQP